MTTATTHHHRPTPEWVSLRQAALWAGPHLPPLEPQVEELEQYPRHIRDQPGIWLEAENPFELQIEEGKRKIAEALMHGRLGADGHKGIEEAGASHGAETEEEVKLSYYDDRSIVHENTFSPIPAEFWWFDAIDWNRSSVRPRRGRVPGAGAAEYVNIRVRSQDLHRVFPDPSVPPAKSSRTAGRRGRPVTYDQQQFWALCALEVAANGLPARKAEFFRRMSEIWSVVIGEPVPERNWFSDRYDEIEKLRPAYKQGRKLLKGG